MTEQTLGEGRYLRLVSNGRWEYVKRVRASGVVAIVPITNNGEIVLVEEPRPAVGSLVISLPAGLVGDDRDSADEAFETAASRELEEETGWRARHLEFLVDAPTSAGLTSETAVFYLGTGLEKIGAGGGVDGEDITVHVIAMDRVDEWLAEKLANGVQVDAKLYSGLYFAKRHLESLEV